MPSHRIKKATVLPIATTVPGNVAEIGFDTTDDALIVNNAGVKRYIGEVGGVIGSSVQAATRTFTETTAAGVYTGSVAVPADATILDILVDAVVLWAAGTSATMKVGDVADDDGYFTGVNLKATDLLAGESISFTAAGGKAGAYIANSQVTPRYAAAARTVSGIVTQVGTGATGVTRMTVIFHVPATSEVSAATKV